MKFSVLSKRKFVEQMKNKESTADAAILISNFSDKNGADFVIEEIHNTKAISTLILNFDDSLSEDRNPMKDSDAAEVIEFISHNKNAKEIMVCCDAGVSRSASVAMFFDFEINHSVDKFLNLDFSPNPHVLNTLRKNFKDSQITEALIDELSLINLTQFKIKRMPDL